MNYAAVRHVVLSAFHKFVVTLRAVEELVYLRCQFMARLCAPLRHSQLPSGSMKISETRESDTGLYVCVASNIAGNLTQHVELSVLGKLFLFSVM